jgi:hypothetical protein
MFNKEAFLEDAKKVHLNIDDTNVREEIDNFIDYDRLLFSKVLDDIYNNVVGNTMFTLLMMKLPIGQKLKIINIGPVENSEKYERDSVFPILKDRLWTSKEECRTIAGYVISNICHNYFDFYSYCMAKERIKQLAVFKPFGTKNSSKDKVHPIVIPLYKPRFGHIGYVQGKSYSAYELQQFPIPTIFRFNLDWLKKYT